MGEFARILVASFTPISPSNFSGPDLSRVVGGLFWFHWESARILKAASFGCSEGLPDQNQEDPASEDGLNKSVPWIGRL